MVNDGSFSFFSFLFEVLLPQKYKKKSKPPKDLGIF